MGFGALMSLDRFLWFVHGMSRILVVIRIIARGLGDVCDVNVL